MRTIIKEVRGPFLPENGLTLTHGLAGRIFLQSAMVDPREERYSFATADPFLVFRSDGTRCRLSSEKGTSILFGNPWEIVDGLMARYELLDEFDFPFPLGGCFGFWGYELKNFVEPRLRRRAVNDLELPECHLGFYDSLVVYDHQLAKTWIISTGLRPDGTRCLAWAQERAREWEMRLQRTKSSASSERRAAKSEPSVAYSSNLSREQFLRMVEKAQRYIRAGDIYQVNLSQRLSASLPFSAAQFYRRLTERSPAPFAAFYDAGEFQLASSSPELFLRMSGPWIRTRPIKGTRPRSSDPVRDAQLCYELQTSPKEMSELVMITDLLRNDLGRVCEYGTVQVPELVRLERFPQVQHLVSRIEGRLRNEVTHFRALCHCFPGGSVTGAPKVRAMEIIDELEPITRGPYTGCLGYVGFNRESQLSILIRTAVCQKRRVFFNVGAGIVSDSQPEAEYDETIAKAAGFLLALNLPLQAPVPKAFYV